MVMATMTEDELANARSHLSQSIREHDKNSKFNVSISYGYALKQHNPQAIIIDLAKIADKEMYKQKALFYSESGVDRRKRSTTK